MRNENMAGNACPAARGGYVQHILEMLQIDDAAKHDTKQLIHIFYAAKEQHIRFYLTTDMP